MQGVSLTDLLDRWEQARAAGEALSAEELCRDQPEFLAEAKRHIEGLLAMRWVEGAGQTSAPAKPANGEACKEITLQPTTEPIPGYQLVRLLGEGGFGEVWEAVGPGNFPVALKFIRLDAKAGLIELRALEVLRDLRHPHLLSTFGAWKAGGHLIVAMDLAERTLADRFREAAETGQTGIPIEELLAHLGDAAEGIDFLNEPRHNLGDSKGVSIQHRDIKPQNLLVVGGRVKVGDLGLARVLAQTASAHSGSMTVAYAPPEFFDGKTHRHSDQYSLAVTYCVLRGGRLPFEGNAAQIMAGHLHREPDLTMLPEQERPVVARALAKEAVSRWPDCRTFVEELKNSTSVRGGKEAGMRPRRRRAVRWVPLLLLVVLLVPAALVINSMRDRQEEDSRAEPPPSEPEEDLLDITLIPPTKPPVDEAEQFHQRGMKCLEKKDWVGAAEAFTESLKRDRNLAWSYAHRSTAHDHLHKYDLAIADADTALRLASPDDNGLLGHAHALRGNAHRHSGQNDRAIADYTTSLRYVKDSAKVYYFRGVSYKQKGDLRKAERDKERARQLGYKVR